MFLIICFPSNASSSSQPVAEDATPASPEPYKHQLPDWFKKAAGVVDQFGAAVARTNVAVDEMNFQRAELQRIEDSMGKCKLEKQVTVHR